MENDNKSVDQDSQTNDTPMVGDMFKNWFLDYASYVILERAVPTKWMMDDSTKSPM
jgi:topoisomerase-4 subunit A